MARRDSAGQGTASDSAVAELEEKLRASRNVRRAFEPSWFLNCAFLVGNQWVAYDGNQLFEPELEDWRAKLVDNRILPSVRREIAKMTKAKPVWVGVPRDRSDRELAAARLRERVFEHYWRELKAARKLRSALRWSRVTGAGFWKVCWDDTKGKGLEVLVDADGVPQKDENGAPITPQDLEQLPEDLRGQLAHLQSRQLRMGEPSLEVKTSFEIFPDDLADEDGLDSCEWLIDEAIYSVDYVKRHYDVELEPDARATPGPSEGRLAKAVGGTSGATQRGVRLREFWALPGSEFPGGKRCVWTSSGELLFEKDNSYPSLPYVMFPGIPVPGRFWPTSVAEQERSPQTERNKRLSQLSENADRIGNPPLRKPSSSVDNEDEWQGLPGEVIVFDDTGTPNSAPAFLDVPELPSYIMNLIGLTDEAMREISSQHEVSAASVPAGVTAASAINLLLEQDDTVLGPDIEDMVDAIEGAGQRLLWMLSRYASDQRIARIAGPEGMWDFAAWKGSELGDCSGDSVQVGSGVPQSKAAKQAALQEVLNMLAQSGLLAKLDERDLRTVLQEYQVGGLEKFFGRIGTDERQVQRENQQLAGGEELEINEFDNDAAHIAGHEEYQKGSAWGLLDQDTKDVFQAHVNLHKERQVSRVADMAPGAGPDGAPPPAAQNGDGSAAGGLAGLLGSQPST